MPFTRTKRSRNLGTANSSPSLTSSSDKVSNKISRFFTKLPREEMSGNSTSQSPYQNYLKPVKSVNLSDSAGELDDFRTPNAAKKVSKIAKLPKKAKTNKKSSGKAPMRKFLEDNLKNPDVNADHLQMALALSESSYEAENPTEGLNSQEKMDNFKKTLEKYGFGYGKNKGGTGSKKDFYSIVTSSSSKPQKTKSRYRFITPVLKMRTQEEREDLIVSKVSLILAQNDRIRDYNVQSGPTKLFCKSLQDYQASKIFKLNNLSLEELSQEGRFYTKGLPVEACAAPCGYLLKDWERIPGRDVSPVRVSLEGTSSRQSGPATPQMESPKYVYDGSVSPDLFGSDDEADRGQFRGAWAKSPPKLSPVKANGGILQQSDGQKSSTMSSYQSDLSSTAETVIVECYDLTQSDEHLEDFQLEKDTRNISESEDEDLKISEKEDAIKERRSGSFVLSTSSSENSDVDRIFTQSKKQNEDVIDAKEYCWNPESDLEQCQAEENTREPPVTQSPEYESLEYDVSRDEISLKNKSPDPGLKNENIEKAPPEMEYSHLSISSTEEITEETLSETESHERVATEKNYLTPEQTCQDLSHSPENVWQSDTVEYQFSESLINNNLKNSEPTKSEFAKTGTSPLESANSEVRNGDRLTPEWEYHSVEYDWQSDAVFQFPEDECQVPEDEHFSPEAINHNCQTSEPPENRNWSPGPFRNDWIPSPPVGVNEEMECYDLSEDDDQEDVRKLEKISNSEDSKLSQGSICISDDELTYSSVHATPYHKKEMGNNLAPLEDSFNAVLGQSMILKQLEPQSEAVKTPNVSHDDNFLIKTKNVTPMANYDEMDTPKIVKELDKFGLKPLKRQRGAKLLKYIYEATHPVVEDGSDDDGRTTKKRRTGSLHFDGVVGDIDEDEWIFEKTQLRRVQSCRIPLHIVWHNFVMSNPKVRENILLYEPLQLEVLHSMLKEQGFRFNIQDLLTFLDRKCVTIRTAQGQRYGKKHSGS